MMADTSRQLPVSAEQEQKQWFGVLTKIGSERLTVTALRRNGIESFVPVRGASVVSGEIGSAPGSVFCRVSPARLLAVLKMPGVVSVSAVSGVPQPIDESVIEVLQSQSAAHLSLDGSAVDGQVPAVGSSRGPRDLWDLHVVPLSAFNQAAAAAKIDQEYGQPAA